MAQVLITDTKLDSLAQRIAAKSSAALPLTIDQMITSVNNIVVSSGTLNLQSKVVTPTVDNQTIVPDAAYDALSSVVVNGIQTMTSSVTSNGIYVPDAGKYFSSIEVNVPMGTTINNQDKVVTPTASTQTVTAALGYTGLGTVTVNPIPSEYIIPTGNKVITENGNNIDVAQYETVSVNVAVGSTINNQDKTISPTESQQIVTFDSGYTGLGQITVDAIPRTYVGTGVARNDADTILISENTVSVPIGYFATSASKTIPSGSAQTPATAITANPSISIDSAGKITASVSASKNITPNVTTGYISSGTSGAVTVSGSATQQLTTKGATTYTPTTTNQTIASGTYLTGAQTISGDSNLIGGNIKSGISIFGVSGTYSGENTELQSKSVSPSETQQVVTADTGYDGLSSVTVGAISSSYVGAGVTRKSAATYTPGTSNQTISSGQYLTGVQTIAGDSDLVASNIKSGVTIFNVTGTFSYKSTATTITPSESVQTATPGTGYDGLSTVTVSAISSSYIGSNIARRTSANVTISGANVTVASGYYSSAITKSVTTATQATPSISVNNSGVITATATQTAGYVTAGTKTSSMQLTTATAATITPSTTAQTAIAANTYAVGAIMVAGDANLIPANISADVSIFGVQGSLEFTNYYTGTSAPTSSLGSDGDIYLQTE